MTGVETKKKLLPEQREELLGAFEALNRGLPEMFPTPPGGRRSRDPPAALQPTRASPNASERRAGQKQVPRIASGP